MNTIYFVEDDDNIRKLVCYALAKEGYDVLGFSTPSGFWKQMDKQIPKLCMLDIMLPQEDGLSILKKLRTAKQTEDMPIIMVTAKDGEYDKVEGLDLGADDYISKPFGMTELVSRVGALLRRAYKMKKNRTEYNLDNLYINTQKHIIKVDGEEVNLSFKEYLLLCALAEADGNVVERDTLLSKVWGEYYEESRTLDVHIRKLRVKLKDAGAMIKTVKNVGYKLEVAK